MPESNTVSALTGKRIVIIEDEGMGVMAFRRLCQRAGLEVVGIASNGKDGVDIALKERPDIVLTDINMPHLNGFETAKLILAQMDVCLVFVTAYSDYETQEQIRQTGCHGCIVKPVGSDALIPYLEEAYERFTQSTNV